MYKRQIPSGPPERSGESAGAVGDSFRFRYDRYSTEEAYSPIAGVRRCTRSAELDRQHVWSTHIDDDGAICSEAIHGPLTLSVLVPHGGTVFVQVLPCCLATKGYANLSTH